MDVDEFPVVAPKAAEGRQRLEFPAAARLGAYYFAVKATAAGRYRLSTEPLSPSASRVGPLR